MELQLCSFELAKLAKEKGFDVEVLHFYVKHHKCKVFGIDEEGRYFPSTNVPKKLYNVEQYAVLDVKNVYFAPTQSLLAKWFRDAHELNLDMCILNDKLWGYNIYKLSSPYHKLGESWDEYNTYENCQEAVLIKAFELI